MDKVKFGSYIKESRIKKNYTQKELADLLFVDVSTVSKWERGVSYPDITMVPDICRVLDITEHELIESSYDLELRKIRKDANKYNNMKKSIFWTLNICYVVALLTCFIVNVAVSHTLSWFFIVLASSMCAYSFCPTVTWLFVKYKNASFIVSTFISLFLLFLTCSLYTTNYWFMIATLGVLFIYFVILYPISFNKIKSKLKGKLSRCFLLSYVLGVFVLTCLLLIAIYLYVLYDLRMALFILGGVFMIPIALGVLNLFEISKVLNKPILISLVCILVILILAGLGRTIYLKGTEENKIYVIEESYNGIKIEGSTLDVNVYLSNTENKVVYSENKKVTIETKVIDGVLVINQNDNRKFYDMVFNFNNFEVDLYLTESLIDLLNIKGKIGDIEVGEGFTFNTVNISNSTGDVEFKAKVTNNLTILNSTGDIEVENSNVGGNVILETSTGDIELINTICNKLDIKVSTGNVGLVNSAVNTDFKMSGSTGDVNLDNFDANNIDVSIGTGNVKGTIRTNKIFIVNSKTGNVSVPETTTGGICKIVSKTGNIKISYK